MALSSRWKILNKELGKWRDVLAKVRDNVRSSENLGNEIMQAHMWFGAIGQGKKSFNHQECWELLDQKLENRQKRRLKEEGCGLLGLADNNYFVRSANPVRCSGSQSATFALKTVAFASFCPPKPNQMTEAPSLVSHRLLRLCLFSHLHSATS
ncbi:unnamed protein product [Prunus armeniaca]